MRRTTIFTIAVLLLAATTISAHAATITVTNANDSGPGSLRQAILNASSGDTINFAPSVTTVTLTSGELVIDKNLIITGPGANRLIVQVNINVISARVFHVSSSMVTVSISGITISNGYANEGPGGGGILSAGVLTLTDCTISDNFTGEDLGCCGGILGGGGVMNDNGSMTITGCTISNNRELDGNGGGGVLNDNGTMTITGSTISNNSARRSGIDESSFTSEGGGISNHSGSLIITNSTISGNACSSGSFDPLFPAAASALGGGVDNSGSVTITNCTISGNSAVATGISHGDTGYGGGISNGGDLQITSSTIAHNSASGDDNGVGGGINGFEPTRTDSSIIALNSASTRGPDYFTNGGNLQSTGYNIIGNNADAVINSQPTDQIGTPAAPIDPLLGPLADNGGPTLTHALQSGSPAINRGDPAAPPTDQRGYGRTGLPDVGAFEFGGVRPRARYDVRYLRNNISIGSAFGPNLPAGWQVSAIADFNRDGHPDYLLFNEGTRQTIIWYLSDVTLLNANHGPTLPSGWEVVATGDFNGDGYPDLLLFNANTRQTVIWYMHNNVHVSSNHGPTLPSGWSLVGVADFNGDGQPDYLLFNANTRQTVIWYMHNNVHGSGNHGPTLPVGWSLAGLADFNGDGRPDYLLFNGL